MLLFLHRFFVTAQQIPEPLLSHNPEKQQIWVDSVYQALTLNQKIGQLFMVQVFSDQDALTKQEILRQNQRVSNRRRYIFEGRSKETSET